MLKRAFRGRPARSLYPSSSSAIFLIALKVKTQDPRPKTQDPRPKTQDLKIMILTLKFKSTFELPNEEKRQGKRAGRPF
jgi:hypothetical protein